MNCDSVLKLISLYYYGELTPDEEDSVEAHLHECAACSREMERQRKLAAAFDSRAIAVPQAFAEDCRADLMAAIQGGAARADVFSRSFDRVAKGPWTLFLEAMAASLGRLRMPVTASALIALGFVAAKLTPAVMQFGRNASGVTAASVSSADAFETVRSVQPDSTGHVQISFDETRRLVKSGRMEDPDIQRLLLAGALENNAAVRVESVDCLKKRAETTDVRDTLLNLAAHDPIDSVRLKALEGLKPLAGDPTVRKTLEQLLLTDEDHPVVRMRAVDMLVEHRDDSMIGTLQNLMQREDNNYVRLKIEKALKEMNASIGAF